ncbi:hypothetical protein DM860_005335 [Cuscuta australis]|uniref:DUF1664 domain-containing protein n=1 Tax=Cuscuta australis TaxID=267555 RepID=A0A328E2W6_9ASTE|nr:hypothetical protein DM860_005335 [Cuscuta australis]
MAMQTGATASKVIVLVGAGLTGSVILKSGQLPDLISQLQELLKGLNDAETFPGKYDAALLATRIRQLAQDIKDLSFTSPVTIFNGDSSNRSFASYLLPAAALGAMGYYYMKWKGWSFSDVMFVTKSNLANAVVSVSKQLENVSDALASTKRHLTKRLETLDWKLDEQKETSVHIVNDVKEVKSGLNQIGYDIDLIHQMVSELEGKIELLEINQDITNSGLWYLCQVAGGLEHGQNSKAIEEVGGKLIQHSKLIPEENSVKGLQFIVEADEASAKQIPAVDASEMDGLPKVGGHAPKVVSTNKMKIHRSYRVGLSLNTTSMFGAHI